ncbi:MAG TPA: CHAT domain-containing protein, partial [Vicinamibacterales bacterium]|nr:CHAT domain-containing protein [Vicinamibacterales bacterium]
MPGPARSLRVDIATRDKQAIVRLLDGDTELAVAPFDFTLTGPHNEQVLQKIAGGKCDLDELKDVGSQLWGMLFAGDVARAFDTIIASAGDVSQTIVRLGLTPRLQALPWETLHDEKDVNVGFLSISKQMTLVRDTPFVPMAGALARAPGEPLSMLVLIPDGSNLNVEEEWAVLGKIREMGPGVTIKRLDGLVTATAIREELRKQTYDIVHYIGHGLDENGEFSIRLNEEGSARNEQWLGAEAFSLL